MRVLLWAFLLQLRQRDLGKLESLNSRAKTRLKGTNAVQADVF